MMRILLIYHQYLATGLFRGPLIETPEISPKVAGGLIQIWLPNYLRQTCTAKEETLHLMLSPREPIVFKTFVWLTD